MKIINYYIATALTCISFCMGACKEDRDLAGEDGSLQLSVGMSDKINIASRTLSSEEQTQLEDECKIRIYSEKALVRKYEGIDNVPVSIPLMSGSYSVRVTAGDSVAASFEQRFFEGKKDFVIAKGENSEVEVACAIANTVVAFTWDESLQEVFKGDCQVTVTSATGELVYSSANADAKGYFNLPADNRTLTCKFTATKLNDGGTWKILFSADLVAKMTAQEGQIVTKLTAIDDNNKQREVTWNLVASNATVVTTEAIPYEIWASKATLHGKVTGTLVATPKFQYRVKGSGSSWTTVDADLAELTFSKEITGLTPGTIYEYQAMDGTQASSVTCEFTTEAAFQPENAGFENTSGSKPTLIYGSGQSIWWDTGNHGSSTANGPDVTVADNSLKHSGNQSILLSSQVAGIPGLFTKFAAGNLFAGKYVKTDGTDGVLGWGRPCTSRPTALKVWVRYEPGVVNQGSESKIAKGETDKGIIYVAVGDWAGQEVDGSTWPFVVKTKNQASLFTTTKGTYSGDGIIGYGEKTFDEAYNDGENLKELIINLDYDNFGGYQRKPTSIIIVASSSKFGDYFEGSDTSKMWLDDMELIYE